MAVVYCDVRGLAGAVKTLDEFPDKLRNKGLRKGFRASGRLIVNATKKLVPVKTGAMQRGIKLLSAKRRKYRIGFNVTLGSKTQGGDSWYAPFIEFGTKTHSGKRSHKKNANTAGKQRIVPREFMKQASKQNRLKAIEVFKEVTAKEIVRLLSKETGAAA
jgi:HK97 gp10 family phage protein